MLFLLIIVSIILLATYLVTNYKIYDPEVLYIVLLPTLLLVAMSIAIWKAFEESRGYTQINIEVATENNKQYVWVPNYQNNKQERIDLTEKYGRIFEKEVTFLVYEQSILYWPRGPQVVLTE